MSDIDLEQAYEDCREARIRASCTEAAKLIVNDHVSRNRAVAKVRELNGERDEAMRTGQFTESEDGRLIRFENEELDGETIKSGAAAQIHAIASELKEAGAFDFDH